MIIKPLSWLPDGLPLCDPHEEAIPCYLVTLRRSCDAYYKASLVKVIGINILYTIRLARLLNKLKLCCNSDRILIASALAVELPILLSTKLRLAVNKAQHLLLANRL